MPSSGACVARTWPGGGASPSVASTETIGRAGLRRVPSAAISGSERAQEAALPLDEAIEGGGLSLYQRLEGGDVTLTLAEAIGFDSLRVPST